MTAGAGMPELDAAIVERVMGHVRAGTTDLAPHDLRVPAAHFVDPARAQAEQRLLRTMPLVVGHHTELPEPGSFVTRTVLGVPLLVVRQADGSVAAYLNICRHRGGQVEAEAAGAKRVFMCRYHGWSYDRDGGGLRHVPFEDSYENVDHACNGLVRLHAEDRHGLLWVTLEDGDDRSVAEHLGPQASQRLDGYRLDESVVFLDERFELELNWKLVMDGAVDPIHPKFLHPEGVGKLILSNTRAFDVYGRHGQTFSPRRRAVRHAEAGEPVERTFRFFSSSLIVYPNLLVMAAPDHVELWTVWPDVEDPRRSSVQIRFLAHADALDEVGAERLGRSWEILRQAAVDEDWPMAASIQRNAAVRPDDEFVYGRSELTCQHLHRQLAADLGD